MTKGKKFPEDIVKHWPEIFEDISFNAIPIDYLHSIIVTFKNGKTWEVSLNGKSKEIFESEIKEWFTSYENEIDNVDFKLDTERIKKDIIKKTNQFLKQRKIK